ncbi:hypothetical protein [Deinococcus peraridilitoris]|uniref:Uncharacterized protein n=1 Tax=Deinococcus peraridilitoris (strain DSM 19664 / LMG 22246 / CIP 109416 / KR-200) TaxID=937777 RepID=L0A2U1_DEIPD|nr:hypothetical protein [Deinococcus peraridilitoris]AFZ68146.1 hypothetical protein Deipe_2681 [Deinococcus peraridilitoris DSM 19664]
MTSLSQPAFHPSLPRLRASPSQNVMTLFVSWWLMIGIFVDGWAHNTFGETLETFFTPWHGVFYSGFLATALWVGILVVRGVRTGRRGLAAVPLGYELAVIGMPVFALGGLGDMIWHTVFGIEVGLEALLSPTHLLLFLGAELLALAPLSSAWQERTGRVSPPGVVWPAVLSATAALSFASFMHMYAWALVESPAPVDYLSTRAHLTGTLLTALLLTAPVLLLLKRWQLPPGAVTVLYLVNTLLMSAMTGDLTRSGPVLLLALVSGLMSDLLIRGLRPSPSRPWAFRGGALALPLLVWAPFYAGASVLGLLSMSLELWLGVSVMSALGGLGLSALILPPALPTEATVTKEPAGSDLSVSRPGTASQ